MRNAVVIYVFLPVVIATMSFPNLVAGQSRASRSDEARKALVKMISDVVKDPRVLAAIGKTERHLFVSAAERKRAYLDMALPIGSGATISPPAVVGFMTEHLDPQPSDKVLEIGTGSGYQAAVLSPLVKEVYTIEIIESLGERATERLDRLGYKNVHVKIGDGFQGWPEHAPFDKIIVTCSPEKIPKPLVQQLKEDGLMVIPLGRRFEQSLCLVKKEDGELKSEILESTFFIPMTGRAEELRELRADDGVPKLKNGSFEEATKLKMPIGWYYLRQCKLEADETAPDGRQVIVFENSDPDRSAQALQAIGVDGRRFRQINLSLKVRLKRVRVQSRTDDFVGVDVRFYDDRRANVGSYTIGPWNRTIGWSTKSANLPVPPKARLAVIGVGLFGATGTMAIDDMRLHAKAAARR